MNADFDILAYGACPDATTVNTAAIQAAIDACHAAGGGRVCCPPGTFVTGSLVLKSQVEFHVQSGCRMLGSTNLADYQELVAPGFRGEHAPEGSSKSLFLAADAERIAITGLGEINGAGPAFYDTTSRQWGEFYAKPATPRPRMLTMYRCADVRIEGVALVDSPCWTVWLLKCERVALRRLSVIGDQRMINNDGIDIDACRDVTVSDCMLKTSDDCIILRSINRVYDVPGICENIVVSNCVLDSWCQGVRIGCPGDGEIRNAVFANLTIRSRGNGILFENPKRYLPTGVPGSADIHDIQFANIAITCAWHPIRISVEDGIALKRLSDISFSDIRASCGKPCTVLGSDQTIIRNVAFRHVEIVSSGDDAVVCRRCQGIRLVDVELTNVPHKKDDA